CRWWRTTAPAARSRLGTPLHLSVPTLLKPKAILQEPPKHLDWLNGQILNVSRDRDFVVTLKDSQSTAVESTSKGTTARSLGGSAALSVNVFASGTAP